MTEAVPMARVWHGDERKASSKPQSNTENCG
jgi:hypothetical protein